MGYRDANAVDLVAHWKRIVNTNSIGARDSAMFKNLLQYLTPCQIILGMYNYQYNTTISVPMFVREQEEWLEPDDSWAEVELAVCVTHTVPPEYYTYQDQVTEYGPEAVTAALEARLKLRDWADRILS